MNDDKPKSTVVIAGISGFVGNALKSILTANFKIIGLTRKLPTTPSDHNIELRACDLFSLKQTEIALQGADYAIYLVHSMMPQDRLTQADFADLDLICADNFARACKSNGIKKIIYLSGIIPTDKDLSPHLLSRLEVERALGAFGVPVISLRAGLIIGEAGSSFIMMLKLTERLPFMVCPGWTQNNTQPICLCDVLFYIDYCLKNESPKSSIHYDIGSSDPLTYLELLKQTAHLLGKKFRYLLVPFYSPGISKLWITVVTGTSYRLVKPLVESLKHSMTVGSTELMDKSNHTPNSYNSCLKSEVEKYKTKSADGKLSQKKNLNSSGLVKSIQRMPLPNHLTAMAVALEYIKWLPKFLRFILTVTTTPDGECSFNLRGMRTPLLILKLSAERSFPDRPIFYICGGLLDRSDNSARLEFREALDRKFVIAAIHDYRPSLPWFIYRFSQAVFHKFVMYSFARHLHKMHKSSHSPRE